MSDYKSPSAASVPPNRGEALEQSSAASERRGSAGTPASSPGALPPLNPPGTASVTAATPTDHAAPALGNSSSPSSSTSAQPSSADEDSHVDQETLHVQDDPLINVVLHDTYRIARVIGEGGMGRVYEAWHTRITKKRYAIKVLHAEYARNIGILKRFQREAETAACLSHPNAVGVYDVDVVSVGQERPYLVSEYLEGVDLSQWIKQKAPLDPEFVKHLALQMCDALIEAHDRGVVHRDLKPQNIFLLTDSEGLVPARPVAKVLDFGLSRFVDDADSELTRSGMVMGTPSYMSPEQARGERADHRVDVYGLGAVMFASVTGRPPYKSSSPQATVLAVMNEEAPRPSKLNPSVSPELELIIQKAMARDPNRRYATMQELRDDLDTLFVDQKAARPNRPKLDSLLSKRQETPSLRLQLSLFWALALLTGGGATVAAIWGAVLLQFGRWPLSSNATIWLSLVLVAGFAAPLLSGLKRIRRNVWSNTAHVAHALQSTRQITLAALATYGATGLLFLLLNLSEQLFQRPLILSTTALGTFPGIAVVCFVTALCVSAAMTWREYLQAPGGWVDRARPGHQDRFRRFAAGPVLVAAATALSLVTMAAASRFPNVSSPTALVAADGTSTVVAGNGDGVVTPDVLAPPQRQPVLNLDDAGSAVSAPLEPPDAGAEPALELGLASAEALSAALSQGSDGLNSLLEQYPNDPGVLRAVAFDQASTSTGLKDAIATFSRLFKVSPQAANNDDVQQIILSIARGGSNAKRKAFELMANDMGHIGPDMLYRLSLSKSTRSQALAYLARPSVRKRFSPALSIAYDLRFSSSCARRLTLLSRATQFGDERSVRLLHSLSASTKTGCGARKSKPCPSKCPNEEEKFIATLEAIKNRLRMSPPNAE